MSVLIKGMEMPTNCADCPLNYDQMACAVTWTRWWSDSMVIMNFDSDKERMPNCPLIEVPTPHGRLIDADKFEFEMNDKLLVALTEKYGEEEAKRGLHFSFRDCICNIQCQKTVIEAED